LQTKAANKVRNVWLLLTEIPGWPDAPLWPRLRRMLPIAIPCVATAVIAIWTYGIQAPRFDAEVAALQPFAALEQEISSLQLFSEQEATELKERVALTSRSLLETPQELAPFLKSLKKEASDRGWEANFQASDLSGDPAGDGAVVAYLPVRGRLVPSVGNSDQFSSLLALLERLSTVGKRIDLMRVSIRADEQKWHAVELNFRLVCPAIHAKSP